MIAWLELRKMANDSMKHVCVLLSLLTLTFPLGAQSFSGPVAGYVFDVSHRSIRPVLGSLGAAYLGPQAAAEWVYASVAPNGKMAVGLRRGRVELIADLTKPDETSQLSGAIMAPGRIVWSADASTAVLYSSALNQLQRITGLGGTPEVHAAVDLSHLAGGAVSDWSVSADGSMVALTNGSGPASVFLVNGDSLSAVPLASPTGVGPSAFSSDGGSLFVFDSAAKTIVQLQISTGAVLGSFDASALPLIAGMQTSPDGKLLYIAGSHFLSALEISSWQQSWSQSLDITPSSLMEFSVTPPVLLLDYDRSGDSPIWLSNVQPGKAAQLYFVPTANAGSDASR